MKRRIGYGRFFFVLIVVVVGSVLPVRSTVSNEVSIIAHEQQGKQQEGQPQVATSQEQITQLQQQMVPDVRQPLNTALSKQDGIDLEQIQKVLLTMMVDFQKKKEEARRHMLELLPEEDRTLILQAREQYEDFLEEVNLVTGLTRACVTVNTTLHAVVKQDAGRLDQLQPIIAHFDKLHQSLVDGSFLGILTNGQATSPQALFNPLGFMPGMQQGVTIPQAASAVGSLTKQDLDALVTVLTNTIPVARELNNKQFARAWDLLQCILSAIKNNDIRGLTACYMEHVRPYIKAIQTTLTNTTAELDKKLALIPLDGDKELRRAYVLLTRELKNYLRTLMVFASLEQDAASMVSNTHTLFTLIAYSFDFYKTIYSFYKLDYATHWWREGLLDTGLRSAIATWHFFIQKADFSNGLLFNTIQGSAPVSSLSPMQLLMYNAILAPFAMVVFINPNVWNRQIHGSLRELGKILTSWVYYHVFHCMLFGDRAQGESTFLDHYDGVDSVWPRDYVHLRRTIYAALTEGQRYVFRELSEYMRMYFYPRTIENVENVTMGLVRPELIGYLFETFLPLVMLDRENFVNDVIRCQPDDVYDYDFNKQVRALCASTYNKPGNPMDENDAASRQAWATYNQTMQRCKTNPLNAVFTEYADRKNMNIDIKAYYVECQLLSYVFSSLGLFWGRVLTRKYQNSLYKIVASGAEKTVNLCTKIGLISNETAEMFKAAKGEFNEGMEEAIGMFKELFKQVFVPGSSIRAMIIPILERRGDITNQDNVDSLAVTKEVLQKILEVLARPGLISYLDVEVIQQTFAQNPTKVDALVDQLVSIVRANFIAMVGGRVGSFVASVIGDQVMWYFGPFYPKVRDWLHKTA